MFRRATDILVEEVQTSYEHFRYRAPIKFAGAVLDRVTLLNVQVLVRNRAGAKAHGFGSMPLGNVWSFPSRVLGYDTTLGAMQAMAGKFAQLIRDSKQTGHPIEINHALEQELFKAAGQISREQDLAEPIPKL